MEREVLLLENNKLQQQLEPLYEMKADITALKESIYKKPSIKYLTISQACELLHVSRSTVNRMIRNGDLAAKKAYKRVLISEKSIEKLLITINQ